MFTQFATDHQGHQLLTVVIGHRLDADQLAVAQYRNALGDTGQLFEPVRNINDRHASSLQARDLFKQHLDFTSSKHRRGLVEDQYMAVADQVTSDLDHLLVTNAQAAYQCVRVDRVQADLGHGFDRGFAQLFAADPATAARQVIQEQVFSHGQRRQQVEFLHDHAHAQGFGLGAAGGAIILTVELHVPGGGRDQAADDLRQGTFACAVLTGQRQHFPAIERQGDVGQNRLGIGLTDTADREDSVRGGR